MDGLPDGGRALPVIDCVGLPRERGQAHGEGLRSLIQTGLERWLDALGAAHAMDPEQYVGDFLKDTHYIAAIERWAPALLEEVRGIAIGADRPFPHLLVYNLMDEEWAYSKARRLPAPGCSVVGVPRAGGRTAILAQTMDIPSLHDGTQSVLRIRSGDAPDALVFTAAGMIALNGCNDAGLGVVVNNLEMLPSSDSGLPVAFVVRGLLERTSLKEGSSFLRSVPHAIGQHYALGSPEGFASFECSARGVVEDSATVRVLHTNHPLLAVDCVGDPEAAYARSRTRERYAYLLERVSEADGVDQRVVEEVLADTSVPVSLEPGRGVMTFGAVSIELSEPPRLRVAPGPPHVTPFVEVQFPEEFENRVRAILHA